MENATEALIMAGQVLIFIVALTICISSFTELRTNVTELIGQTETINMATDSQGYINYIESTHSESTRVVGVETVIASMYRAVKEDYVVYIKLNDTSGVEDKGVVLYEAKEDAVPLKEDGGGNNPTEIGPPDKLIKVTIGRKTNFINQNVDEILRNGLYNIIKDKRFYEYLGEYQNGTEASSENRLTKRIITYVEI